MKKFFAFMGILALILVSNCTEIPTNHDPILGKWTKLNTQTIEDKGVVEIQQEWFFNDVNLGRYHRYENGEMIIVNDFSWNRSQDIYTISYRNIDLPANTVILETNANNEEQLAQLDGDLFAHRE